MMMLPVIFLLVLAIGYLLVALSVMGRQVTQEHK